MEYAKCVGAWCVEYAKCVRELGVWNVRSVRVRGVWNARTSCGEGRGELNARTSCGGGALYNGRVACQRRRVLANDASAAYEIAAQ